MCVFLQYIMQPSAQSFPDHSVFAPPLPIPCCSHWPVPSPCLSNNIHVVQNTHYRHHHHHHPNSTEISGVLSKLPVRCSQLNNLQLHPVFTANSSCSFSSFLGTAGENSMVGICRWGPKPNLWHDSHSAESTS